MTDADGRAHSGEGLEADLLAVAERRDRDAFGRLFAFYAPRVKAYLGRLGAGDREADDLAQEAMLVLWRQAPRFDPGRAALSTWVFTIAREIRVAAASVSRPGRPEFDPEDPALVGEADGASPTGNGDVLRLVRRAVERMPREQAEVLHKFYHEGRPGDAAAAGSPAGPPSLGGPEGSSPLRQALDGLRVTLGGADA